MELSPADAGMEGKGCGPEWSMVNELMDLVVGRDPAVEASGSWQERESAGGV